MQILHGVIMNAWHVECGHSSLAEFAKSNPTPARLCDITDKILENHARPNPSCKLWKRKEKQGDGSMPTPSTTNFEGDSDNVHRNLKILARDLLFVLELIQATSDGDFGRIEDILGQLAMIFRGAGSNNYCAEILHFIFNLKRVWTPEFA